MHRTFPPRRSRRPASVLVLAGLSLTLVLSLLAAQGCSRNGGDPDVPEREGAGDLEIQAVTFTPNDDGETVDVTLDFFDNLVDPTIIEVGLQVRGGDLQVLKLTCHDAPGQKNTCTGGTGTCSGDCPDRTYDEFPGKTFSGTCKKPKLGLPVCTCTDYRVKDKLGLALSLAPDDSVTVTLDPNDAYPEASETNNTMTLVYTAPQP